MSILDRINGRRAAYRLSFFWLGRQPKLKWWQFWARFKRWRRGPNELSPHGEIVLSDLSRFCRARSSTAAVSPVSRQIDPLAMAMAEGRREVWLRIQQYLNMDERVILKLRDAEADNG
jgi:hypothetical protein